MSRSTKSKQWRFYKRETKDQRKLTVKRYRLAAKKAVKNEQEVPVFRGTEGWDSW